MQKTMKVLVTGGGGFLGHYIVEKLIERGGEVTSFSRKKYPALEKLGVGQIEASIIDREAVIRAMEGCEAVFHVASRVGIFGAWEDFYETNVTGAKNVIEGCLHHGVKKLVYTSSPSVVFDGKSHEGIDETYPVADNPIAYYAKTKGMAEREVIKANGVDGLLTCALRPHLIWGPRDTNLIPRMIERANSGKLKIVGDGRNLVDNTYVENGAEAHLLALDKLEEGSPVAGSVYFISQGEPVNPWEFVNRILAIYGAPKVTKKVPLGVAYVAGAMLEVIYRLIGKTDEPVMTRFLAKELATSHWFNIDKARSELGYEPVISLEEGMVRLAKSVDRSS